MKLILLTVLLLVSQAAADSSEESSRSQAENQRPHKPHIVYFLVDNWNEVGYQDPFYITPFMDELAATGIKLTHWYTAILCTPSRSRLMAGKHEVRYGMQTSLIQPTTPYGLPTDIQTLPDRLRELGYSTHQVGKWHLGHHRPEYTPLYRGFDTFYGYYNGMNDYYTHGFCCPLGQCDVDFGYDMRDQEQIAPLREIYDIYDAFIFTKESNRIIDRQFNYNGQRLRKVPRQIAGFLSGRYSMTYDDRQRGPAFLHSPLFPNKVNGTIVDDLTTIMDLFPTILNMAGDHVDPSTTDGVDLWDLLVNGEAPARDELLQTLDPAAELVGESMFPDSFDTRQVSAIRVGDYKLITGCMDFYPTTWDNGSYLEKGCHKFWHDHHRNYFLYNIRQDPLEENDLAEDPALWDRIVHMVDRLQWWEDQSVPPLSMYPEAQSTLAGCPSYIPENEGRTYKFYGPYMTGEDWQLSTPRKPYVSPGYGK